MGALHPEVGVGIEEAMGPRTVARRLFTTALLNRSALERATCWAVVAAAIHGRTREA